MLKKRIKAENVECNIHLQIKKGFEVELVPSSSCMVIGFPEIFSFRITELIYGSSSTERPQQTHTPSHCNNTQHYHLS